LFTVFGIITLGMTAFSRYIEGGRLNLWVLGSTIFLLISILYFPLSAFQSLISPPPQGRGHGFSRQLCDPISGWTAGETAADRRVDYRCASCYRNRVFRSNHRC
jgi:hypothetical protein